MAGDHESLTLAELVATLALATDLAMAHPLEQGLGACLVSTRMAELAGLPPADVSQTFYIALLRHIGCTTENQALAELVGDEVGLSGALNPLSGATGPEYIGAFVRFATAGKPRLDQARAVGRIAVGMRGFASPTGPSVRSLVLWPHGSDWIRPWWRRSAPCTNAGTGRGRSTGSGARTFRCRYGSARWGISSPRCTTSTART